MHRFTVNGLRLALDVNSGAVHILDELSWSVLEQMERYQGDVGAVIAAEKGSIAGQEVEEVLAELEKLKAEGFWDSPAAGIDFLPDYQLKSLCLNVAHDCNLRCKYCFAGTGHFGGRRGLMDLATGKAALDLLLRESKRHFCEVDFFGGEPLLNFKVVKELVYYGKRQAALYGKEIRFTLTTNATLLDAEVTDFLNLEGLQVVLSLDGRPEIHDAMRPARNGEGSYQQVVSAIRNFISAREKDYYVRGTFTALNLDFAADVVHLAELGIREISLEPVVAGRETRFALREEHLAELESMYEHLAVIYLDYRRKGRPFNFFHFNISLDKGPCLPKRLTSCGAGYQYLAVTPEGELYPCHQFVGRREYLLGDVWEGLKSREISDLFRSNTVQHRKQCRDCWARYYCSGGCQANAFARNGSIEVPDELSCKLMQKRLECALYVQAAIKLEELEDAPA